MQNYIPKLREVKTDAQFGSTSTTYNEASYTFNENGQTYGGRDFFTFTGPKLSSSYIDKPQLLQVTKS